MATAKVLIVDDDAEVRARLGGWLAEAGYQPLTAADGCEALEHLRSGPVDLIISDVLMPRMDGYQLCRAVKQQAEWSGIPFVFFSSTFVDHLHRELGLSLGASEYLAVNPEKGDELIGAVERLLERHRQGDVVAVEAELRDEVAFQRAYHRAVWQKLSGRLAQNPDLRGLMERYGKQIEALQQITSLTESPPTHREELLGQIVRTLEHEINNPLAVILTLAQLAEEETVDPDLRETLHGIEKMVFRINSVVSRLKKLKELRPIPSPTGEILDLFSGEASGPGESRETRAN